MARFKVITDTSAYEITERGDLETDASAIVENTVIGCDFIQLNMPEGYRTFKYEGTISDANGILLWEFRDMADRTRWLRVYND